MSVRDSMLKQLDDRLKVDVMPTLTSDFVKKGDVLTINFDEEGIECTIYIKIDKIIKEKVSKIRTSSLVMGDFLLYFGEEEYVGQISINLPVYIGGKRTINYSSMEIKDMKMEENSIKQINVYKTGKGGFFNNIIDKILMKN
ncbi:hypothetical protein [Candidatus Absconditicoccus praedator]|uniref:hypothetical protein n=1 Tax=Candidatus Absconditicoccus praedator TaxID=2735562 RepID=UPI001E53B181|nr:hypothetical protein [Candidatus Absconditicoccus praedator]UFX83042.1 hypothetical protein HLG78_02805 [Candidatus Absconditicoccus praedator]